MANYYRGLNAYYAGDYARAQHFLLPATREVPDTSKQARAFCRSARARFTAVTNAPRRTCSRHSPS